MNKHAIEMLGRLQAAGISTEDALALRRIAMRLHRWFELECGDGNKSGSWAIVRGRKNGKGFTHDDDGGPHLERHYYRHGNGADTVTYQPLPDYETGARKRLAKIIAKYPGFAAYVQTDPRGAPLYILRPGQSAENYNNGIAVYK